MRTLSHASIWLLSSLLFATTAYGLERKPPYEIEIDALTKETQIALSTSSTVDLAWWLPVEFWDAVLSQDPALTEEQRTVAVQELSEVFVIAIAQANISPLGHFEFYEKVPSATYYDSASGDAVPLVPLTSLPPGLVVLLDSMKTVLANAIGSLGKNLQFFVYQDSRDNGKRLISPYDRGRVSIELFDRSGTPRNIADIKLPLNALFVPRVCPNGQAAHVSWRYCPWDGSELPR